MASSPSEPLLKSDVEAGKKITKPVFIPVVESLDYETVESEVHKDDIRSMTKEDQIIYELMKWVFVLLIGVCTALVAFGINMCVENLAGLKYITTLFFLNGGSPLLGVSVFTAWNVLLVLSSATMCAYIAPTAAGSGIPEVKGYLNGINTPDILSLNTLFVKVFGSIGSVGAGLAVGKEGPLVHVGSCIAALLGQGGSKKYHLTWKGFRMFKNDRDRRDLVTCGAAAGVAAAFRSPLGGVLFALEEATSWWRSPLLWRAFFTNAIVAVVLKTAIASCTNGRCGIFGGGGFIIFDEFATETQYELLELFPVTLLGVIGGLLGSAFIKVNLAVCRFRAKNITARGPGYRVLEAVAIALITSVVQFAVPFSAPCSPCPAPGTTSEPVVCPNPNWIGNFKSFNCPEGQYNDLASLMFNTNDDAIRNLFSGGTQNEFKYLSLFVYAAAEFGLASITYGIAVPSGLFVPTIICGASYGRMVGRFMTTYLGSKVPAGTYALIGAASFLGGAMRMTVSLCIILLELTGNLAMLPLIMLVLLVSKMVGDIFTEGVYDTHLKFRNVPLLEAEPEHFMKKLSAKDAVKGPPVTLAGVETVGRILDILESTTHNAFPVIDHNSGSDGLYGLILRSHLIVLLRDKSFFQGDTERRGGVHEHHKYSSMDFGKPGYGKDLSLRDVAVSEVEKDLFLDLHPFINASPYTVSEGMNLSKVYSLFRCLGLRHLCVVPKAQTVLGVLTRKDLLPEELEKKLEAMEEDE